MAHDELIGRLAGAFTPDRALDAALHAALHMRPPAISWEMQVNDYVRFWRAGGPYRDVRTHAIPA